MACVFSEASLSAPVFSFSSLPLSLPLLLLTLPTAALILVLL